jgi:hypothetical protein
MAAGNFRRNLSEAWWSVIGWALAGAADLGLAILYLARWRNPKSAAADRQASEAEHQPGEF